MASYDTEQGGECRDKSRMDEDLIPFLRDEFGMDAFVDEFPYNRYDGIDCEPSEDLIEDWLNKEWTADTVAELSDYAIRNGPYRTDLVGVDVDRRALETRIRRLGHLTPLNQPKGGKRKYRRSYLSFVADGPMTREYWELEHNRDKKFGSGEVRSYAESSAKPAFGWLKKREFLVPVGNQKWDAVDIPIHIHRRTHAFELKLSPDEWRTALKQASRADVFADYCWVVYDRTTAHLALANIEDFERNGIGLLTVHPDDGVEIEVWPERCSPKVNRELLDRYNVERWDLNERVLTQLNGRYETERDPDKDADRFYPNTTDVLGQIEPDSLETDVDVPTANGYISGPDFDCDESSPDTKPLTEFS